MRLHSCRACLVSRQFWRGGGRSARRNTIAIKSQAPPLIAIIIPCSNTVAIKSLHGLHIYLNM
eukprot:7762492-Lingulodinium_polyedra.AAC.1